MANYNQFKALKALTKASFISLLKSPASIFFSIAFPLIFIIAFGIMSDTGTRVTLAFPPPCDTSNQVYSSLQQIPIVKVYSFESNDKLTDDLKKGSIAAVVNIQKVDTSQQLSIELQSSIASGNDAAIAKQVLESVVNSIDEKIFTGNQSIASIKIAKPIEGRAYRYLDFFLPGMLGFSMLSAGIFGTAFIFFNLKQTLVLKRFFATPVKRIFIIIAEGSSRLILQMIAAAIIIIVGYFAFDFTLLHGFQTFFEMMILCFFGLVIFLGMGFIISSIAKNESLIPPLANMITMPQLLLSGVFLSTSNFPDWLQPICNALPLTQLNNALRAIAFQGKSFFDVWQPILILGIWGILVYAVAVKVFRWE
jgi:ABC-2 type transport system permease protein